jgi:hypothetical protein
MGEGKTITVVVGIPNKGAVDETAYDNHLMLFARIGKLEAASQLGVHDLDGEHFDYPEGVRFKFAIVTIPRVFPALAREKIAEEARDIKADYLFMFDDDMMVMPDLFERLFRHQKDYVAALAFSRLPPYTPVIYNLTQGWDGVEKSEYYLNHTVDRYPKDQLVECDAVGFGAVLISMKALLTIKQPWFMTTSGAGEDIHNCHQARKAGIRVFMDTATKIGHLGERPIITEETYESTHDQAQRTQLGDERKYPHADA